MDFRLALLLRIFSGFNLTPDDLDGLLAPGAVSSPGEAASRIVSEEGSAYLRREKDWCQRSEAILQFSWKNGIRWSYPGQPDYPAGWNHLSSRPPLFSYKGEPVWLHTPLLSIVGSRTPLTDTCSWMQRELPRFFQATKAGVVSGGARGVDQWSHRLALAARMPTVCVFPSGLCNPYPFGREDLWESILLGDGSLVSTLALHEPMRKQHFLQRNRWIAGLSDATFVAEANRRSGSMITADHALNESREVGTLPVSVNATQGLANLDLIAERNVHLIRDSDDLLTMFNRNRGKWSGPGSAKSVD